MSSASPRPGRFLGLISGTSMDGVDAVLIDIDGRRVTTIGALSVPYPDDLRAELLDIIRPQRAVTLHALATLDVMVGRRFADAALSLLERTGLDASSVEALGSHGQTLRHHPRAEYPYTLQIGDPATIAARCGITTVADFRSLDVAYGGEGAPLVPPFHACCLRDERMDQAVLNIGGIANVSLLPREPGRAVIGYDTGPGNCLMDEWTLRHRGAPFDRDGAWAAAGTMCPGLLNAMLSDPYFERPPPKSTGRETFNLEYLMRHLSTGGFASLPPSDVQATLLELSVETIARELQRDRTFEIRRVLICGGGVHNRALLERLRARLPAIEIGSTALAGIDPDLMEASAFAWLASMRIAGQPVSLTTGAVPDRLILGAVYEVPNRTA